MKTIVRAGIVLVLTLITGCVPAPGPVSGPIPSFDLSETSIFQDAEKAFEAAQYSAALDGYNAFLQKNYETPLADDALFKIGKIFELTGQPDNAIAVFSRITREFPQGNRAFDAMLAVVDILYATQRYAETIEKGTAFIDSMDSEPARMQILRTVGDAYTALEDRLNAARYYYRVWNSTPDEARDDVWSSMKRSIERLEKDDIRQLIAEVTDKELQGLLLYRLGMANIMDEEYDQAHDVLTAFVERFPTHPAYQDATDMLSSLDERARFVPFTVGCILPLSGPYALFGKRALDGIELALSQIEKASEGIPFTIMVKDSRSDHDAAIEAVDELNRRQVGAILGPMAASPAAARRAQADGIPILVFTQRAGIPDLGDYVFRNFITPRMQVDALVSYAVKELGVRRFAILYPDEPYGKGYMNLFWDQVIEKGGVVNAAETYDPQDADFARPIKKLAGIFYDPPPDLARDTIFHPIPPLHAGIINDGLRAHILIADPLERLSGLPFNRQTMDAIVRRSFNREERWHPIVDFDAVFIPDAPKKAGLIIPQLAYYDIRDVYLLGTNLWNSKVLLDMSGAYMKETLVTDGFFAGSPSERVKQFVDTFQLVYQRTPGVIEAAAYDSAWILFQTMRRTATNSRRDLKQALLQLDGFEGVSGQTGFNPNGEARKQLAILRVKQGRFVQAPQGDSAQPDITTQ